MGPQYCFYFLFSSFNAANFRYFYSALATLWLFISWAIFQSPGYWLKQKESNQPPPVRDKKPEPGPYEFPIFFLCLGERQSLGDNCYAVVRSTGPNIFLWQEGIKVELKVLRGNGERKWGCLRPFLKQRINVGTLVITCFNGAHLWMGCSSASSAGLPQNIAAWTSLLRRSDSVGLISSMRHPRRSIYYPTYWYSRIWNSVAWNNQCCFHICFPSLN